MKIHRFLALMLVVGGTLLTFRASEASACSTCKLGRGMPDTISNGLLQTGGVGADPMHSGVSFDPDDLRAEMSAPAYEDTSEVSYVFGLNTAVQMSTGLDSTNPASYDPMQFDAVESAIGLDEWAVPSPTWPFASTYVATGAVRFASVEPADIVDIEIADPRDADRHGHPGAISGAPEPASLALLCLGLLSIGRRRGK